MFNNNDWSDLEQNILNSEHMVPMMSYELLCHFQTDSTWLNSHYKVMETLGIPLAVNRAIMWPSAGGPAYTLLQCP